MAGIVAKHRWQMKFRNSHLMHNIFNLYMRRYYFGLVYIWNLITEQYDRHYVFSCMHISVLYLLLLTMLT